MHSSSRKAFYVLPYMLSTLGSSLGAPVLTQRDQSAAAGTKSLSSTGVLDFPDRVRPASTLWSSSAPAVFGLDLGSLVAHQTDRLAAIREKAQLNLRLVELEDRCIESGLLDDPGNPYSKEDMRHLCKVALSISKAFDAHERESGPLVVSLFGPVGCGKSTFTRYLKHILRHLLPKAGQVKKLSLDGLIYSNQELERRGIFHQKGSKDSHNMALFDDFYNRLVNGQASCLPGYCHKKAGPDEDNRQEISADVDILLCEGMVGDLPGAHLLVKLDADEAQVQKQWFARLKGAIANAHPDSLLAKKYRDLSEDQVRELAFNTYEQVNVPNNQRLSSLDSHMRVRFSHMGRIESVFADNPTCL